MSSQHNANPFAGQSQPTQFPGSQISGSSNNGCWWVFLLFLGTIFFLFVLILIGVYIALRNTGLIRSQSVPPPQSFQQDAQEYVDSLTWRLSGKPIDAEISQWIDQQLASSENNSDTLDVPTNIPMFVQASEQSTNARNFGFSERALVRLSVTSEFPYPDVLEDYTVLAIRRNNDVTGNKGTEFATADILFYDSNSQVFSIRWYLVKVANTWQLYDWQRLEYGRRTSDEYAAYVSEIDSDTASGYDEAMHASGTIISDYQDSQSTDSERFKVQLMAVEKKPVLEADRGLRDLRIAWSYEAINQPEESLRLLRSINDTNMRWGTLSTEAYTLLRLSQFDAALEVAQRFHNLAPNHPNALECISIALSQLRRDSEAKPYLITLLKLCPKNRDAFRRLLNSASEGDLPFLLQISQQQDDPQYVLNEIVSPAFLLDYPWPAHLANWREVRDQNPKVHDSMWLCIDAADSLRNRQHDRAVELLKQVAGDSNNPLHSLASQELKNFWIMQKSYKDLFDFAGPEIALNEALEEYYYDGAGFLVDCESALLEMLESSPELNQLPQVDLVRAIYHFDHAPQSAEEALNRYFAASEPVNNQETDSGETSSNIGLELGRELLIDLYLHTQRPLAALERFGVNPSTVSGVKDFLMTYPSAPDLQSCLERISQEPARETDNPFQSDTLEILAAASFAAGRFEEADQHLQEAMVACIRHEGGRSQAEYRLNELVSKRVSYVVLDRAFTRLELWDPNLGNFIPYCQQQCLTSLAELCSNLYDKEGLQACIELQRKWNVRIPKLQCTLALNYILADLDIDESTAVAVSTGLVEASYTNSYRLQDLIRRVLEYWIIRGKISEAEEILNALADSNALLDDEEVKLFQTAIAIRSRDFSRVEHVLSNIDPEIVGDWLQNPFVIRLLRAHPEEHSRLVTRFIPFLSNRRGPTSIYLLQSEEHLPSETQMRSWLQSDGITQVVTLTSTNSLSNQSSILATLEDGSRLLLDCSATKVTLLGTRFLQNLVTETNSLISITILEASLPVPDNSRQERNRVLWNVTQKALNDDTIAVAHNQHDVLWLREKTDFQQLKGEEPPLLSHSAIRNVRVYPAQQTPQSVLTLNDIGGLVASGRNKITCAVHHGNFIERVSGELIDGARSRFSNRVRLTQTSQLCPELQEGLICEVPITWLEPENETGEP